MGNWEEVTRLAARQYGLIERGQAVACGVSLRGLNQRATREGWERPHPGVLALPGSPDTPSRRVLAAILAVNGEAYGTRWTAAFAWGLVDRLRVPVTVLVPHTHRAARLQGVATVRTRSLVPADVTVRGGLPVVTVARLLVDLAPVTDLRTMRGLAIDARQRGVLDLTELWALWERFGASVQHRRLRPLVQELVGGGQIVDSLMEHDLRRHIVRYGLPAPFPEPYPVVVDGRVVARIDLAWPQWKVGVECDGFRYHSEPRQLRRDSDRQNRLTALAWKLIRVTWEQMQDDLEGVLALIHKVLHEAGAGRAGECLGCTR